MAKIDFKKELKHLYSPAKNRIALVEAPKMSFLMADGAGDPTTAQEFGQAVEALYSVAYTVKFSLKKADGSFDYVVPPLEGLWWADDMEAFLSGKRDEWKWTLMIMQPEQVTEDVVRKAVEGLSRKKDVPGLERVRLESYEEGLSAQMLYVGPYSEERSSIERLHDFIRESGRERRGKHHEIYLSDPRRTEPEKLKTILRQPVK
ncbi:MAG: GyrI-like domain-containing protein [Acidobacteriota bacterium]